jgi:hypothetical protein
MGGVMDDLAVWAVIGFLMWIAFGVGREMGK